MYLLAAGECDANTVAAVVGELFETAYLLAEPQGHPILPHLINQRVDDFEVDECKKPRPLVDDGDSNAKRGKDRSVFQADHTGPNDDDGARNFFEAKDIVAGG